MYFAFKLYFFFIKMYLFQLNVVFQHLLTDLFFGQSTGGKDLTIAKNISKFYIFFKFY
jgi:hypothetical protein